jgi:hypothetical protein
VDADSQPASTESDVVGGRPRAADEYRSVGLLVGQFGHCTATLVAPQVVLTATHCSAIAPVSFCIDGDCAKTDSTRTVPEAWRGAAACPAGGDMSLVHLSTPMTMVAPMTVEDVAVRGETVCDVVGFGGADPETAEATVGRLRIVQGAGSGLRGIGIDGRADTGDSGGPVICDGKLAAITSCGLSGSAEGWYVATHPFHSWIRDSIDEWSRPAACARFDMRCERAADHDEMWSCDDLGHWQLLRSCPAGNCSVSRDGADCPD